MDEPIVLREPDEGLAAELNDRINEFNARATGIDDGRLLQAELRDDEGALVAGLTGWTWADAATSMCSGSERTAEDGGSAGSSSTPQKPRRMSAVASRS
jgi:hypothetical protein